MMRCLPSSTSLLEQFTVRLEVLSLHLDDISSSDSTEYSAQVYWRATKTGLFRRKSSIVSTAFKPLSSGEASWTDVFCFQCGFSKSKSGSLVPWEGRLNVVAKDSVSNKTTTIGSCTVGIVSLTPGQETIQLVSLDGSPKTSLQVRVLVDAKQIPHESTEPSPASFVREMHTGAVPASTAHQALAHEFEPSSTGMTMHPNSSQPSPLQVQSANHVPLAAAVPARPRKSKVVHKRKPSMLLESGDEGAPALPRSACLPPLPPPLDPLSDTQQNENEAALVAGSTSTVFKKQRSRKKSKLWLRASKSGSDSQQEEEEEDAACASASQGSHHRQEQDKKIAGIEEAAEKGRWWGWSRSTRTSDTEHRVADVSAGAATDMHMLDVEGLCAETAAAAAAAGGVGGGDIPAASLHGAASSISSPFAAASSVAVAEALSTSDEDTVQPSVRLIKSNSVKTWWWGRGKGGEGAAVAGGAEAVAGAEASEAVDHSPGSSAGVSRQSSSGAAPAAAAKKVSTDGSGSSSDGEAQREGGESSDSDPTSKGKEKEKAKKNWKKGVTSVFRAAYQKMTTSDASESKPRESMDANFQAALKESAAMARGISCNVEDEAGDKEGALAAIDAGAPLGGGWFARRVSSRVQEKAVEMQINVFYAGFDQRSRSADGHSACSTLTVAVSRWLLAHPNHLPIGTGEFESIVMEGSAQWRTLCAHPSLITAFPDRHFDLDTVFDHQPPASEDAPRIRLNPDRSFVSFFRPPGLKCPDLDALLEGSMTPHQVYSELARLAAGVWILAWNDHFAVLEVRADGSCHFIDTLGERLLPGCDRAFIMRFPALLPPPAPAAAADNLSNEPADQSTDEPEQSATCEQLANGASQPGAQADSDTPVPPGESPAAAAAAAAADSSEQQAQALETGGEEAVPGPEGGVCVSSVEVAVEAPPAHTGLHELQHFLHSVYAALGLHQLEESLQEAQNKGVDPADWLKRQGVEAVMRRLQIEFHAVAAI